MRNECIIKGERLSNKEVAYENIDKRHNQTRT